MDCAVSFQHLQQYTESKENPIFPNDLYPFMLYFNDVVLLYELKLNSLGK